MLTSLHGILLRQWECVYFGEATSNKVLPSVRSSTHRKNELEEQMLLNLSKKAWAAGLVLQNFQNHSNTNSKVVKELKALADRYDKVGILYSRDETVT